jgi:hypothetical protein
MTMREFFENKNQNQNGDINMEKYCPKYYVEVDGPDGNRWAIIDLNLNKEEFNLLLSDIYMIFLNNIKKKKKQQK